MKGPKNKLVLCFPPSCLPVLSLSLAGATLVVASLAFACHGSQDGTAPPPNAGGSASAPAQTAADTVVRAEDDGKSFDVTRGSTVIFKLASNGGTGYAWTPTQVDPVALVQQGDRASEASSDAPGAPKLDVYRFTASGPAGATAVEMSLRRSFGGGAPARVVRVTINVK
jgi:predicted secreted protein